jgi:hypothetical protein
MSPRKEGTLDHNTRLKRQTIALLAAKVRRTAKKANFLRPKLQRKLIRGTTALVKLGSTA